MAAISTLSGGKAGAEVASTINNAPGGKGTAAAIKAFGQNMLFNKIATSMISNAFSKKDK